MSIPVYIPATTLRPDYRPILEQRLGSNCTFIVDEHHDGAWFNLQRCLNQAVQDSVTQGFSTFVTAHEDVFPVADFQTHLQNAVACKPGEFFSGFSPWRRANQRRAYEHGFHWVRGGPLTSQCFVWPVSFVPAFLAWANSDIGRSYVRYHHEKFPEMRENDKDDIRVLCYFNWMQGQEDSSLEHVRILITAPSLVEHMGEESSCWNYATNAYMKWKIKADAFVPELSRPVWSPKEYKR